MLGLCQFFCFRLLVRLSILLDSATWNCFPLGTVSRRLDCELEHIQLHLEAT